MSEVSQIVVVLMTITRYYKKFVVAESVGRPSDVGGTDCRS